jgi:hypothetical protein
MDTPASSKSPPSKEKDYVSAYNKRRYQAQRQAVLDSRKEYYLNNKETIIKSHTEYRRKKYHTDPAFKLRDLITRAVNYGMKKNGQSITKYLPYSLDELKEHTEKQFESWMNWDNHGVYDPKTWDDNDSTTWTWNLDHIIPQSDLPYTSMGDDNFKKCWGLNNLRPLSSKQNFLDGINRSRHSRGKDGQ